MANVIGDLLGGYMGSNAARAQGLAQYQLAQQRQLFSGMQASDALARGGYQAGLARMKGSELASTQKVAFAASGVDPSVGTPAQVQVGTQAMAELDAQLLKNNAAREAWGYKVRAVQEGEQGQLDLIAGNETAKATLLTSGIRAGSNLVSTAMKFGGGYG